MMLSHVIDVYACSAIIATLYLYLTAAIAKQAATLCNDVADIGTLSMDDLQQWARDSLDEYGDTIAKVFKDKQLNGETLLMVKESDIRWWGLEDGPRLKMIKTLGDIQGGRK